MVDQCDLGSPVCIDVLTRGLPRGLLLFLGFLSVVARIHRPSSILRLPPIGASTYVYIFYGVPQQQSLAKLFAGDVELTLPKKGEPHDP